MVVVCARVWWVGGWVVMDTLGCAVRGRWLLVCYMSVSPQVKNQAAGGAVACRARESVSDAIGLCGLHVSLAMPWQKRELEPNDSLLNGQVSIIICTIMHVIKNFYVMIMM